MKIALIKETKTSVDNRVALAPKQVAELKRQFPQHQIVVQASDICAFSDKEYRAEGVKSLGKAISKGQKNILPKYSLSLTTY